MADSHRLTVLKRLTALIEATAVSPVEGIDLPATLQGHVFRGRLRFGDDEADTLVSILEAPRQIGSTYSDDNNTRLGQWSLLVQGWCPEDKLNPTDSLYSLLDDVERQLDRITQCRGSDGRPKFPNDYMLGVALNTDGHLITGFTKGDPVVRPAQEGVSSKSFFYLPVQVGLSRIASE